MVLPKHELEAKLQDDLELVQSGVLRDENPLDSSDEFNELIQASRRGDLKRAQELILAGVNLNGKDKFDYTPLIIASLCGHYEMVELLLESGALAERDTFQGERCIYNALNDKIRNLLLKYDYSKSTDPLQPWAAYITSLFTRRVPKTSDITVIEADVAFKLHKFILSARSPYFREKLAEAPDAITWRVPHSIPIEALRVVLRYLYLGEISRDVLDGHNSDKEAEILIGIDKISNQLGMPNLWETMLYGNDRRLARQRHQDEVERAQQQVEDFFNEKILGHKMTVDTRKVFEVKWPHGNSVFADCLLRADEGGDDPYNEGDEEFSAIPVGPTAGKTSGKGPLNPRKSVLYPAHKAMLIRSPYFATMFSSKFLEAQESEHLHITKVDCPPKVLEIILRFLYTEVVECPLELTIDLLYASDMLLLDKLKNKAAILIASLGSGNNNLLTDRTREGSDELQVEVEPINVYDVIHAAWDLRVQRLEEFAARYLAYRLEDYIDEKEFAELITESASRVKNREETDTIELLDDIRYYLGVRFRLRFEDAGLYEMLDERGEIDASAVEALTLQPRGNNHASELSEPLDSRPADTSTTNDGGIKTLGGVVVEDEFASDAFNYQMLLKKIDVMLENLKLDA